MNFENREQAAKLLADALMNYKKDKPLVLGIPRGAIPMAKIIAEALQGELGAILVHKIPAPGNPEFAIASIGLSGHIHLMPYTETLPLPKSYLDQAAKEQLAILKRRQQEYGLKDFDYKDRIVIIVDDGIATGATILSAIEEIRAYHPSKIIVAAAVASPDSAEKIRAIADKLTVLNEPKYFYAVGQFFDDFRQVEDQEVIDIFRGEVK